MRKMTKGLTIIVILTLAMLRVYGQLKTVGSIDFYCNGQLFSIDYGVWNDPIQGCDKFKYDFYTNTVNFNDIPQQDSVVIERIKQSIKIRGGQEFYDRLILRNLTIAHRPKKCDQRKYTLRFIFPIDTVFYHLFSLTYDEEGNLISAQQFPDNSTNKKILNFIDYCTAIDIALQDTTFKKAYDNPGHTRSRKNEKTGEYEKIGNLPEMELAYDQDSNSWIWRLYTETVFDGDKGDMSCVTGTWTGQKIIINAHDSSIMSVEDYKEFKTVTYSW